MKRWLVIVENDLEPRLVGPFKSEEERDGMAKFHKEERGDEDGMKTGFFRWTLNLIPKIPKFGPTVADSLVNLCTLPIYPGGQDGVINHQPRKEGEI